MKLKNKILFFSFAFLLVFTLGCKKDYRSISESSKKTFLEAKYAFVQGNFQASLKLLEQVLDENRYFLAGRIMKIKSLYYLNQLKEALEEVKVVEEFVEDNQTVDLWKSKILDDLGQKEESKAILQKIVQDDPYNFRAHYELAKMYQKEKDFKNAFLEYKEALSIEPTLFNIRLELLAIYKELKFEDKVKAMVEEMGKPYREIAAGEMGKEKLKKILGEK